MAKPRVLEWTALDPNIRMMSLGATICDSSSFPSAFRAAGINPREPTRNHYGGLIVSRPEQNTFVFGLNYIDSADNSWDEDIYKYTAETGTVEWCPPKRFEREYPQYAQTHHANKAFLRQAPPGKMGLK